MSRSSRPVATALIVVPCLLLLFPAPLRLWNCPLCAGVARRLQADPTSCPSCRDGGRVSLMTRCRRAKADPLLLTLIQDPPVKSANQASFFQALTELLRRNGASSRSIVFSTDQGRARFASCDGEDVVLVVANQSSFSIPGTCRTEGWMLDLQGKLLDQVAVSCSTRDGIVSASFVVDPSPDEAVVRIDARSGIDKVDFFGGFELRQSGQGVQPMSPKFNGWPADGLENGVCQFGISRGSFRLLPRTPSK